MNPKAIGLSLTVRTRKGTLVSRTEISRLLGQEHLAKRSMSDLMKEAVRERFVVYRSTLLDEPELDCLLAEKALCLVIDFGSVKVCHPMTVVKLREFKANPFTTAKELGMADVPTLLLSKEFSVYARFKAFSVFNHAISLDSETGLNTYEMLLRLCERIMEEGDHQLYMRLLDNLWLYPVAKVRNIESEIAQTHFCFHIWVDGTASISGNFEEITFVQVLNKWLAGYEIGRIAKVSEPTGNISKI
jgi:hypothetical protein